MNDRRPIIIDEAGGKWAWHMGYNTRATTAPGIEGRKVCPFAEGTPHRKFWWAGWLARSIGPLLDELGR